jgi:hypothetical protein
MFGVHTVNLPNYWTITWMSLDVGIRNFGDQIEKTPFLLVFCSGKTKNRNPDFHNVLRAPSE